MKNPEELKSETVSSESPFSAIEQPGMKVPDAAQPSDTDDPSSIQEPAAVVLAPIAIGALDMIAARVSPDQPMTSTERDVMSKALGDLERRYAAVLPDSDWILWLQLVAAVGLIATPRVGPYLDRLEKERQREEEEKSAAHAPRSATGAGTDAASGPSY